MPNSTSTEFDTATSTEMVMGVTKISTKDSESKVQSQSFPSVNQRGMKQDG